MTPDPLVCPDCGALIADAAAHKRFHSILNSHAWALAVIKNAHLAAHTHDRYDIPERIDSKRFDNWSSDAFRQVSGVHPRGGLITGDDEGTP